MIELTLYVFIASLAAAALAYRSGLKQGRTEAHRRAAHIVADLTADNVLTLNTKHPSYLAFKRDELIKHPTIKTKA